MDRVSDPHARAEVPSDERHLFGVITGFHLTRRWYCRIAEAHVRSVADREAQLASVSHPDPGLARSVCETPEPRARALGLWTERRHILLRHRERPRFVAARDVGAIRCETYALQLAALEAEHGVIAEADHPAALIRRRYRAEPGPESGDLRPVRRDVVELDLDRLADGKAESSARHATNARPCDT